ncbi:acetoacetyl-CoA reductase [soil metagenome]
MEIIDELKPALAAISGGLGDIGQAMANALRAAGAEVALGDLAEEAGGDHYYSQVDVTDADSVERWYGEVAAHFGCTPNIIIPNAATATFRRHLKITAEDWKREIDVNLNGAFYFADSGTRRLVAEARTGRVIFLGSWAGHAPHPTLPAYSAAKAGLRMLTKTLALELAPRDILVNEVAPGYVHAGLSGKVFDADPQIAEEARRRVPDRKLITAEEVAKLVLHLCGPASTHLIGTTILQDGGLSLLQGPFTE